MKAIKKIKDKFLKLFSSKANVPRVLFELVNYFRLYGPINFKTEKKDGYWIATSEDFKYGSIVTTGKDEKELERNIEDAILTSFEVPAVYAKEADIHRVGNKQKEYAFA